MYIVEINNGTVTTPIHGIGLSLKSGQFSKSINSIDSFTFTMMPNNPGFHLINEFTTYVYVINTKKNAYDFVGRVLYADTSMDENGLITKTVTCESLAGLLCDSVQTYVDTQNWTVSGMLAHLINCHNSQVEPEKQFKLGTITASDANDNLYQGIQRENTWEAIKHKLIEKIGGELQFRLKDGDIYIDYLEQIGTLSETAIELSVNMKSITREQNPTTFISRLIPLGCKLVVDDEETEHRLDISAANDGKNYIDDEAAIAVYGIHVGVVEWDNVTSATTLMNKGIQWLAENNKVQVKYSITALDLSLLGLVVDDFEVGNTHPIKNNLLGIDDKARIIKKTIDICEEVKSSIEVGDNFKTLSDIQREQMEQLQQAAGNIQNIQSTTNNLSDKVSSLTEKVNKIDGIDGLYFYVMYSPYADGHQMTSAPTDATEYMGTCSTNESTAPTDYRKYTWVRIRGNDGIPGEKGEAGQATYFHVKYSSVANPTSASQMTETPSTYIGTYVDYTEADSTDPKKYTWVKFMGEDGKDGQDGIAGTNGVDGKTQYLHIKYSDDGLTFTSGNLISKDVSKWESGYYMNVKREQAYTICTPYFIPVTPGAQYTISVSVTGYSIGITQYGAAEDSAYVTAGVTTNVTYRSFTPPASTTYVRLYIRSVDTSATFETLSAALKSGELVITMIKKDAVLGEEPGAWIGTLVDFNEKDSTVFSDYTWNKVVGENGTPGEPGEDGRTQYLHIKYSDDGQTFTANNGEELGAWIGTLVDFNEKDSDVFSDYTWKLFTEDVTEELEDIRQTIIEQQTSIINTCDSIVMSALKSYVETSTYEEFKSALETEFKVWAEGISATVTATEQSITEVDGDLQQKFNQITKYFTFDINGLTIGQEDNQNKVVIDNDEITILVNNMPIQKFTAEGKALIPDLKVTTQANFMGLRITEDATNINCDYNGG